MKIVSKVNTASSVIKLLFQIMPTLQRRHPVALQLPHTQAPLPTATPPITHFASHLNPTSHTTNIPSHTKRTCPSTCHPLQYPPMQPSPPPSQSTRS